VIAHTGALISIIARSVAAIQGRITLMQDRCRQLAEIFLQRMAEIWGQKLPSANC
jgi:hypothetical protein